MRGKCSWRSCPLFQKLWKKFVTKEIILYGITGVMTTIINFGVSYLLYNKWHINENSVTIIAWFVTVTIAYILNAIWVFEDYYKNLISEIVKIGKFYASRIFTYVVEALGLYIFITLLGFNFWVVKCSVTIVVIILNYILAKFLVFLRKDYSKKGIQNETKTEAKAE